MKPLTLDKAVELHEILGIHIPKLDEVYGKDALKFIGKIVDNIKESNRHEDYANAVVLMTSKEWDKIKLLQSNDILELFVEGLSVNKIVQLKSFCDKVGFANG